MISAIMLAAGLSSRMNGENKLTKQINGIPLINHSLKNILGSSVNEIIVVVGYEKNILKKIIVENKKIKIIYNKDYKNGIASSIKIGIKNISKKTEAFFISLGDMPNVNQNVYNKLIKARNKYNKKLKVQHKKEIIIPTHKGKNGNPILFSKYMKNKIMKIEGDAGAKSLIELNMNKILKIPFKNDGIVLDFDKPEDFNSL
jgi:molybdenum cofactor cytidylyltransferase